MCVHAGSWKHAWLDGRRGPGVVAGMRHLAALVCPLRECERECPVCRVLPKIYGLWCKGGQAVLSRSYTLG